jgi:ABC-type multidrug transport system fused ATPase/permease subunit
MARYERQERQSFWQQINQPPLNPRRMNAKARYTWSIFGQYFLKPHLGAVLVVVLLGSVIGGPMSFFYAWTAQFITDDIVEVHRIAQANRDSLDPTLPAENRRFEISSPRPEADLSGRIDQSGGKSTAEKMNLLWLLAAMLVGVLLLRHFGTKAVQKAMFGMGNTCQYKMRHHIYKKLHSLPMSFHDSNGTGRLMTHLFGDVQVIQQSTIKLLRQIPMNIMTLVIGLALLLSIDLFLASLVLIALPLYAFSYTFFHRRLKTVHGNLRERNGWLTGHIANRISHFYLVKAFGRENWEGIDFLRRGRPIIRDALTGAVLSSMFAVACGIISGICLASVLWISALWVRDGQMTLGTLLLFYTAAGQLFAPIGRISALTGVFHRLSAACQKARLMLDEPNELSDADDPTPLPTKAPALRFDNVSFRYEAKGRYALEDVSFELPAGKSVCVMGASGSGKTTLAKLACRIYDPSQGTVLLDETDIRSFRLQDLRDMTGYVNQEPIIFDGTIRDNIRYGSEDSHWEEMISAAQFAQIHEYITQLPRQYRTITTERGLTLSGGQKQRVNLARALLYDPKLLVLDDCTSALDAETEVRLIRGFETFLQGRTALLVSHRISIALRCNYVLVLEDGKLAEFGPPRKLIESDGAFAELFRQQSDNPSVLPLKRA